MLGHLRLIIVFAAALWLPLQAVAAAFMPMCQHGVATGATMHGEQHCDMHDAASGAPADPSGQAPDDCDRCGFCHLAGASALPATPVVRLAPPSDGKDAVPPAPTFLSFIPEPPRHPPKA
jgi:hypothetical protein